jgi:hypothetical protein
MIGIGQDVKTISADAEESSTPNGTVLISLDHLQRSQHSNSPARKRNIQSATQGMKDQQQGTLSPADHISAYSLLKRKTCLAIQSKEGQH